MPLMGALLSLPQQFSKGRLYRAPQPTWVVTFALVFQRHDEPFGVVGTDVQPGTADEGHHLLSPTDTCQLDTFFALEGFEL
jgi:hypothetical protein